MRYTMRINGLDHNPWHAFGLTQNPFPKLAKAEYGRAEQELLSLDGDPVRSPQDIRDRLAMPGWPPEFVEGLIARWQPGKRVEIELRWPDERVEPVTSP